MRTILLLMMLLVVGCARYEYELVQPADWAGHIGSEVRRIDDSPLVYRFQSYDNRLVMRIENGSDEAIRLIGRESWVVTPAGESRPLRDQSIAPRAFIKLILPPLRPRYVATGPSIGFGISSGGHVGTGVGIGTTLGDDRVYTLDDDAWWDWKGESSARLRLIFEMPDGRRIDREFVFDRRQMR